MAMTKPTLMSVFDEPAMAEDAINALEGAGFGADQIYYSSRPSSSGFFASLRNLFTESGDTNVSRDLKDLGLSNDEADYYQQQHRAGHGIVAVHADGRESEALSVLQSFGAHIYGTQNAASQGAYDTMATDNSAYDANDTAASTYQNDRAYNNADAGMNTYQNDQAYNNAGTDANTYQNDRAYNNADTGMNTYQNDRAYNNAGTDANAYQNDRAYNNAGTDANTYQNDRAYNNAGTDANTYQNDRAYNNAGTDANTYQNDRAYNNADAGMNTYQNDRAYNNSDTRSDTYRNDRAYNQGANTYADDRSDTSRRREARVNNQNDVPMEERARENYDANRDPDNNF